MSKKVKLTKKDLPIAGLALGMAGLLSVFFTAKDRIRDQDNAAASKQIDEPWQEAEIVK